MDLPIPGSPLNSTIEPGTRPPPSTRSISPIPLAMRSASALDTAAMASTAAPEAAEARALSVLRRLPPGRTVSTSVFHAPQPEHWPDHLGALVPHCWQT